MTVEQLHDEIHVIDAIYPGSTTEVAPQIYNFSVPEHEKLIIQISFPINYPDEIPDVIQVIMNDIKKYRDTNYLERNVTEILSRIFNEGEVCMYELFSELHPFLEKYNEQLDDEKDLSKGVEKLQVSENKGLQDNHTDLTEKLTSSETQSHQTADPLEGWTTSDAITDRGSTFIAYSRKVHSVEEAEEYLNLLITDKKIAKATHNISSWRIKKANGIQYQDCDDDGETAAGGRLLHLLTMMDVWNIIVVVSRWFGGIHLGPDRFKHINTAARDAIIKGKFGNAKEKDNNTSNTSHGKKKKK